MSFNCGSCNTFLNTHQRKINCSKCSLFYHVKCSITIKEWNNFLEKGTVWLCKKCTINYRKKDTVKCSACRSTIQKDKIEIQCSICNKFYHSKCAQINSTKFETLDSWMCNICIVDNLPFAKLDNEKLKLTMQAKDTNLGDHFILSTSFTIQSLLDKIPGTMNYNSDDFLADSISSRYYTPSEFLTSNFQKLLLVLLMI